MQALLHNAPPLVTFLFVMSITPGPNNLMLLSSGARFGLRRTLPQILGITSGFLLLLPVTYAGVGAVVLAYPALKSVLTVACVLYLLWLGFRLLRAGDPSAGDAARGENAGARPLSFWESTLFQLVNPKGWGAAVPAIGIVARDGLSPGFIEGTADGLASFAKLVCGFYSDRLPRRKPLAVAGYILTALGTASLGFAASAWQVLAARSTAWLGRGVRTPVRKALLAAAVTRETYGPAFGFERMMDTLGAIIGPTTALILLQLLRHDYGRIFILTVIPGLAAAVLMAFAVQERSRVVSVQERFRASLG